MRVSLFLAVTLIASGLSLGQAHAALVLMSNINGYGFDNKGELETFSKFLFDDATGKVLARGHNLPLTPSTTTIDGQGQTLLPGFIDGHGHVLGLGQLLNEANLRASESQAHAIKLTAQFASEHPNKPWIIGRGWNQMRWPNEQFPSKALLDEAISHKPVWLTRIDGHAGWANSKALSLAGISKDTLDPPGGEIVRDSNGEPTGLLIDNAMLLVEKNIPPSNEAEREASLQSAFTLLLSLGVTSVHDAGIDSATLRSYQRLKRQNNLPIRLYAMLMATDPELKYWLKRGPLQDEHDQLVMRAVKVFGDGALGSRGAALLAPYQDAPTQKGLLLTAPDKLSLLMQLTLTAGFQTNVHAIGDFTNQLVLDKFEQLSTDEQRKEGRHRIEHAQIVAPPDIPRFAKLHILPSMQPSHATSDKGMAQARLGLSRLRGAYAWKTFKDQGSKIIGGSDFPVEFANPFFGLHAAVTRQDQQNQPEGGWRAQERLSLVQALKAFTVDAAYGAFQEERMGSLLPGQWADFILIDRDIFQNSPETLWQTQVQQTWVAGKKQYAREQ